MSQHLSLVILGYPQVYLNILGYLKITDILCRQSHARTGLYNSSHTSDGSRRHRASFLQPTHVLPPGCSFLETINGQTDCGPYQGHYDQEPHVGPLSRHSSHKQPAYLSCSVLSHLERPLRHRQRHHRFGAEAAASARPGSPARWRTRMKHW